jgi:hypothetical protein
MIFRSNKLLAALAVSDILFLLFVIPHSLAVYPFIAFNTSFRRFYYAVKMPTVALMNWSSAIAIWLILTICFERLIAIRYPLSSRKGRVCNTNLLISLVVIATGILTAFHHVSHECFSRYFCHGTQLHGTCYHVDSPV